MQAISENKLMHHLERVAGDHRPITADVFLDNFCNNRCSWCTFNRWEKDGHARGMSFAEFVEYTERLLSFGVQGIILTGGGEPTINRDFDAITQYLEGRGVSYGINTNFNVLKFFKPDYLKVSLDGYDEESYEAIRGVRMYSKVRENIKIYSAWKREKSPTTNLGIQIVVTRPEDVKRFYEANNDLPVDYIVFRPVESTGGKWYQDESAKKDAEKIIAEVEAIAQADKKVVLNYKWNMLGKKFEKCLAHWAQIAIDERGNVIYCCHKPYEKIGHILDPDIMEKYEKAATDMSMCDVPCRLTAPNMFMEKILERPNNISFI